MDLLRNRVSWKKFASGFPRQQQKSTELQTGLKLPESTVSGGIAQSRIISIAIRWSCLCAPHARLSGTIKEI